MNEDDRKLIAYWLHECEQSAAVKRKSGRGDGGRTWERRAEILRRLLSTPGGTDDE